MNAKANDTTEKTLELCEKLYLAAKASKTRRFHALYDKAYRKDFLAIAWKRVKENKGSAGVDNESISDIVQKGEERILEEIQQSIMTGRYRPQSVRRVFIPKPDGRERPLGIPTVRDRIVQTAVKILLEPIFEADFLNSSFGFRPKRSAHDALEEIRKTTNMGYTMVLDADIKGYFDNINHDKLVGFVQQRISDRRILKLIRKWLECGVIEADGMHETEMGTPQGGVISPLLANIYLHEFDKFWTGQKEIDGKLIRYADDFVILFRTEADAKAGKCLVEAKLRELGLELNEKKTAIVNLNEGNDGFDFLGFHNRRVKSLLWGKFYTQKWPSNKAMNSIRTAIRDFFANRATLAWGREQVLKELNPKLRGWMNYFKYGNSAKKFGQIDRYVYQKLIIWYCTKHKQRRRRWQDYPWTTHIRSGVQILSGNIIYWSKRPKAQG